MNKFTHLLKFVQQLCDDRDIAYKAKGTIEGLLKARSPRLSDIAREMSGKEEANYRCIQRFLASNSPQQALLRLFWEEAPFVIRDPTEMPRPTGEKERLCRDLERRENEWILAVDPGHSISWACHTLSFRELLIQDDQR